MHFIVAISLRSLTHKPVNIPHRISFLNGIWVFAAAVVLAVEINQHAISNRCVASASLYFEYFSQLNIIFFGKFKPIIAFFSAIAKEYIALKSWWAL